jgi:hypothetical protein
MPYVAALVRSRASEGTQWVDLFDVDDHIQDSEEAMRSAVAEYLSTADGEISIQHSCGDFNWGDALNDVTHEIWRKHGLKLRYSVSSIHVDQDEVLIPLEVE